MDYGHQYADKKISAVDRELKKTYRTAQKQLKEKLADFEKQFARKNKEKKKKLDAGEITQDEYRQWMTGQVFVRSRWQEQQRMINAVLLDHNRQAMNIVQNSTFDVFAENYNFNAYLAEQKMVGTFNLYNAEAVARLILGDPKLLPEWDIDKKKDYTWNQQKVNNILRQSIIQGKGIDEITQDLADGLATKNYNRMRLFARTAITEAENAGRQQQMNDAAEMGIEVKKMWIATHDNRTRDAHRGLDGDIVPYDQPFHSALGDIQRPGDPDADPANVYNCRCCMRSIYPKYDQGTTREETINGESYEEWKKGKKKRGKVVSVDSETKGKEENKPKKLYSVADIVMPERPEREDFDDYDKYNEALEKYKAERKEYSARMKEEIQKALTVERFKSKEEIVEWAKNNEIELSDDFTEKMDIRAVNEISTTLDEMFSRFPKAKNYDIIDFDGSIYKSNYRLDMEDDDYMCCRGGISFNPKKFGDFESALVDALYSESEKTNVMGDGTFSVMIRHEYGHRVDAYIRQKVIGKNGILQLDDWRTHYSSLEAYRKDVEEVRTKTDQYKSELKALKNLPGSCDYSNASIDELFAEGFAEWSSGGKTEFGIKFGEFFQRWYK